MKTLLKGFIISTHAVLIEGVGTTIIFASPLVCCHANILFVYSICTCVNVTRVCHICECVSPWFQSMLQTDREKVRAPTGTSHSPAAAAVAAAQYQPYPEAQCHPYTEHFFTLLKSVLRERKKMSLTEAQGPAVKSAS